MDVDELVDMQACPRIVGMPYARLKDWLHRRKDMFPARYRPTGRSRTKVRMLYKSELEAIKRMSVIGHLESKFTKEGRLRE